MFTDHPARFLLSIMVADRLETTTVDADVDKYLFARAAASSGARIANSAPCFPYRTCNASNSGPAESHAQWVVLAVILGILAAAAFVYAAHQWRASRYAAEASRIAARVPRPNT